MLLFRLHSGDPLMGELCSILSNLGRLISRSEQCSVPQ